MRLMRQLRQRQVQFLLIAQDGGRMLAQLCILPDQPRHFTATLAAQLLNVCR